MAPAAERKMYAEPRVTVMGGYQEQPRKVNGKTFEPLMSIVEPTLSTEASLFAIRLPFSISTNFAPLQGLASDCSSPMSHAGMTAGNNF
eukprot:CAMPEP_0119070690 /NCGR_PEP_ID=MMETSP1178-20130426/42884_1 /TAXON_ID=33656 /ORGANISM="unid sp, Strain CCMP2000" /LENGTH=88 /DNA_ID=CAMNT_0007052545 /DNA_START=33 /DNA_END=299 /DNA_ORIENTATION=+